MKPALAALALATSLCSVPALAMTRSRSPLSIRCPAAEPGRRSRPQDIPVSPDEINAAGGVNGKTIEIVGLDNKANPQESLIQAQKAADQGIRVITQGNSSAVAAASPTG